MRTPLPWLAALLVAYLLGPIGAFVVRLGRSGAADFTVPGLGAALGVSLLTATVATVVIAVLGVPLGYLLAKARGRLATTLGVAVQLPLALPPLISGLLLVYLVGPYTWLGGLFEGGLTDNLTGIVLAQVFVAAPFLIIAARSAFGALDPELDGVAATLGHGRWSRFAHVALPGALAGIRAGLLLAWLRAFGEFGATVVLAYHPYSLPVYTYVQFGSSGVDTTMAPVAAAIVAAVLILALSGPQTGRRRKPHRSIRPDVPPAPTPPTAPPPTPLSFDLDAHLGGFALRLAHTARVPHLAILGPSGAGKSLTLKLLAGLATPRRGWVRLGTTDVTSVRPELRDVGYVPQNSCLLPHLTTWRQVTFGVGADPGLAAYWLANLHLTGLENRLPHQLSGGQARRVALARALARRPRLLLLDEPFTGLDTAVRDELRRELRRVQRATGVTTVLVTHDPREAALLAEEILLVSDGTLVQSGAQPEVFARPASPLAARLLGIPNLGTGRVAGPDTVEIAGTEVPAGPLDAPVGSPAHWCIRPESVQVQVLADTSYSNAPNGLATTGQSNSASQTNGAGQTDSTGQSNGTSQTNGAGQSGAAGLPATLLDTAHLGGTLELILRLADGTELTALTAPGPITPTPGDHCTVRLPPPHLVTWPAPHAETPATHGPRTDPAYPAQTP